MRTFQEFISEASKTYPSSVNQVAVRKKEKEERKTARDDMYSKPMTRAPGGPEPKRTPETKAAAERERNLPNSTKLRKTEKDISHQKGLEKQALHNIRTGNTSSSAAKIGKSLEQMKAELAAQRIKTFGSEHPLGPAPTPKPRPAPAAPIKKTKRTPPAAPIKRG
jgi:hypothetical protein